MRDRTHNSIISIIFGLLLQIITIILTFLDRSFFIYILGEVYLGINGLFKNVLGLLSLAELGIGTAISFYLYKPAAEDDRESLKSLMRFYKYCYRGIGMVIFIIGVSLVPFLGYIVNIETNVEVNIVFVYLLFVTNSAASYLLNAYKIAIFTAYQQTYKISGIQVVIKILTTGITIILLAITKSYYIYMFSTILSTFLLNITIGIVADKHFPLLREKSVMPLGKKKINQIFKDVYASFVYKIGNVLLGSTDNIMISAICGTVVVGYYSNYYLVINAVQMFYSSIMNSIIPSVGNMNADEDEEKQLSLFYKLDFANAWLMGFCTISMGVLLQPFIYLWTKRTGNPDYLLSDIVPILLSLNYWLTYYLTIVGQFKITKGLFWQGKYIQMITGIVNIVLSIVLGRTFGLIGIIIATTVSILLVGFVPYAYYVFHDGFHKPLFPYILMIMKRFMLMVVAFAIVCIACLWIREETIGTFIYRALMCMLIPNAMYYLVYRNSQYFDFIMGIAIRFTEPIKRATRR